MGPEQIADGLVTAKQLRGPHYIRLFPDVYVDAELEMTYSLRSRAAYALVQGRGVLCGYSAAELLHAGCGATPSAEARWGWPGRLTTTAAFVVGRADFADEVCVVDRSRGDDADVHGMGAGPPWLAGRSGRGR